MELVLENLAKRFGRRRVFTGISGQVARGECLVVTGPNGSGKSTLLQIIAGLQRPTHGRAIFRDDQRELDGDARRGAVGLVAPDLQLYGELTALENLRFFQRLRGLPRNDPPLQVLLERVNLGASTNQPVREFSSGMHVRLKYAFALFHAPPFLLLDEPTANLDVQGASMVEEITAEQLARGALVLATNDPGEFRFGHHQVDLGGMERR